MYYLLAGTIYQARSHFGFEFGSVLALGMLGKGICLGIAYGTELPSSG
jgi:hypothetical protein